MHRIHCVTVAPVGAAKGVREASAARLTTVGQAMPATEAEHGPEAVEDGSQACWEGEPVFLSAANAPEGAAFRSAWEVLLARRVERAPPALQACLPVLLRGSRICWEVRLPASRACRGVLPPALQACWGVLLLALRACWGVLPPALRAAAATWRQVPVACWGVPASCLAEMASSRPAQLRRAAVASSSPAPLSLADPVGEAAFAHEA